MMMGDLFFGMGELFFGFGYGCSQSQLAAQQGNSQQSNLQLAYYAFLQNSREFMSQEQKDYYDALADLEKEFPSWCMDESGWWGHY